MPTLDNRPTLLMGDLNEWRAGSRSSLRSMMSHFGACVAVPSFPARFPLVALDRMMACTQNELSEATAHRTALSPIASDHLPIKARLRLHQTVPAVWTMRRAS